MPNAILIWWYRLQVVILEWRILGERLRAAWLIWRIECRERRIARLKELGKL